MRVLRVTYDAFYWKNSVFRCVKEFYDWFDFADWLKQMTLKGMPVCIRDWQYGDSYDLVRDP